MKYDRRMYHQTSHFLGSCENEHNNAAVIFVTMEGIQHQSGGVARYIGRFIRFLAKVHSVLLTHNINIAVYALEPALLEIVPSYDKKYYQEMRGLLSSTGGRFYKLINNTFGEDWIGPKKNWELMSSSAAAIALNIAEQYDFAAVITGSSCFAMMPVYIHKQCRSFQADIRTVYMTNDSAFSAFYKYRDEDILAMDYLTCQWTKFTPNAKIGYVSENMKSLFQEKYFVQEEAFVPTKGGVDFEEDRFLEICRKKILHILKQYGIPADKKIVFSWGRPQSYKRFDLLFQSAKLVSDKVLPVVVTNGAFPSLRSYIKEHGHKGILIESYQGFELIKALVKWENTCCTCFLSEGEPGAITPMEAMYMAYGCSSIVLAHDDGIYREIIEDGNNGFLVKNNADEIAKRMGDLLNLDEETRKRINREAFHTVQRKFSAKAYYWQTLHEVFPQFKESFVHISKEVCK